MSHNTNQPKQPPPAPKAPEPRLVKNNENKSKPQKP